MASMLVVIVVCLLLIVSGQQFKRVDQCGRYSRLKDIYSTGWAYSNIECTEQCLNDKNCMAISSCTQDKTRWRTCDKSGVLADLYNCSIYEMDERCSTWEKVNPCQNKAHLINRTCVCLLPYKGVLCQFYQPVSCLEFRQMALDKNQTAASKTYFIFTSSRKRIKVFCHFKNETFSVMYMPKFSLSQLTAPEFKEFVPNNRMFMLRDRLTNLTEKEAIISMLPCYPNEEWTITLGVDKNKFYDPSGNNKSPFIFIGGIPLVNISQREYFGFVADKTEFSYTCSDNNTSNDFIFYSNITTISSEEYGTNCRNWQNTLQTKDSLKLPTEDYFFFPEFHFKCGAYCNSNNFLNSVGLTAGFIFS